jgi:beta-lactamase class A
MSLLREKTVFMLEGMVDEFPGVLGIYAQSLTRQGEYFAINEDEVFPTASAVKIPILMEFFRKSEEGFLDPTQVVVLDEDMKVGGSGVLQHLTSGKVSLPLQDYAALMVNVSDNTATNFLIDMVGMGDVNRLLESLGFTVMRLKRKMQAHDVDPETHENLATPKEMAQILELLYNEDGVSKYVCENTLRLLRNYKEGVIRNVATGDIPVANKDGWMGGVRCDNGIVYLPKGAYVISVMAKHIPNWDLHGLEAKDQLSQVVSVIHDYFQEVNHATKYGRRV